MSILIKGMKMPRSCGECRLRWRSVITDMDTCKVLLKGIWKADLLTERLEDCPLVEVPAPHGRLVDAEALKEWSEIVPLTGDGGIDINDFDEKLVSMPSIIDAEEGEAHEQN